MEQAQLPLSSFSDNLIPLPLSTQETTRLPQSLTSCLLLQSLLSLISLRTILNQFSDKEDQQSSSSDQSLTVIAASHKFSRKLQRLSRVRSSSSSQESPKESNKDLENSSELKRKTFPLSEFSIPQTT